MQLKRLKKSAECHLHIVSCIECLQVKFPVWLGSPQPQVDGVVGVEPRDWIVIGNCSYLQVHFVFVCNFVFVDLQVYFVQLDMLNANDTALLSGVQVCNCCKSLHKVW